MALWSFAVLLLPPYLGARLIVFVRLRDERTGDWPNKKAVKCTGVDGRRLTSL